MDTIRTTLAIDAAAYRIAQRRARQRSISLGKAVSDLLHEAAAHAPAATIERRANGMPTLIPPPGTPPLTAAFVRQLVEDDE